MDLSERDFRYFHGEVPRIRETSIPEARRGGKKILIVKLGSAGDVLRTTSLLKGLKDLHGPSSIYWVVDSRFREVLSGNPYVDVVLGYEDIKDVIDGNIFFDVAVNLDMCYEAAAVLRDSKSAVKKGFTLGGDGEICPVDEAASVWYGMGMSDSLKKSNKLTYHDIIHDISGCARNKNKPVLAVSPEDRKWADDLAARKGIVAGNGRVGVNIGGSSRWRLKTPGTKKWGDIIEKVFDMTGQRPLLFAGPSDREKHSEIMSRYAELLVDTGTDNTFGQFFGLLDICDVLVTADTLALHVAVALGKRVVAIFGPTSSVEIELYGRGVKIVPEKDCVCCYRERCDIHPSCMEEMDPVKIAREVKESLDGTRV